MNVANLALEGLRRHGDYTAAYFEGRAIRSAKSMESACRLAALLRKQGVRTGDRVVLLAHTSPNVAVSFQAIWRLGAVAIPIVPQSLAHEIRYIVENSSAQTMLATSKLAVKAAEATRGIDGFHKLLVLGESDPPPAVHPSTVNIAPAWKTISPLDSIAPCVPSDLAAIVYTSGTTDRPKGVMLSHGNLVANARSTIERLQRKPMLRTLMALPMSHVYGIVSMNIGVVTGAVTIYLERFDAAAALAAIEEYRIERASLVPAMLVGLIDCPERERYDTSSLKNVTSGSAPLSEEVRLEFQRLYDCRVANGYGQSEASCVVTAYRDEELVRPGSCGCVLPGITVRVIDRTGRPSPPGTTGEICIRGDSVMQGYWHDERATREAIVDDWLHTGDMGYLDKDGYLFITDRKKDLIIKGGENISPREIEAAIGRHPAVAECAVFGVPDAKFQEEIAAAIVLKRNRTANAEEIGHFLSKHIGTFKRPAYLEFCDALPKNSNHKILKRVLQKQFEMPSEQ